jgi:hypothetical protein
MNVTDTAAVTKAVGQLEALAYDLSARGLATTITTGRSHPCVRVVNESASQMCEDIYAAPARDGSWWFWWSWADRIAPLGDVGAAALKIAYVLMAHGC